MPKKLPPPTKKLYRSYDLTIHHQDRRHKKPIPVQKTFAELFLDQREGCVIHTRKDLERDSFAKLVFKNRIDKLPTTVAAMNYCGIWNRNATYLCEEIIDEKGKKESTWYKIDATIPNNRTIQRLNLSKTREHLTFSEMDKIPPSRNYEFDGTFTDLLEILITEGFQIKHD